MTDLGLILRHRIPLLNPSNGLYSTGLYSPVGPVHLFLERDTLSKISDNEIELFLNDLTDEDWVFMVTPDGTLKAMMVPKLEVGSEINKTIIDIFEVIDPAILDTIMDLSEAVDDTDLIQKYKNSKETLH